MADPGRGPSPLEKTGKNTLILPIFVLKRRRGPSPGGQGGGTGAIFKLSGAKQQISAQYYIYI